MKQPLLFVQDPNALKNWLLACGLNSKVIYDIHELANRFNPQNTIVLIQISKISTPEQILKVIQQQFDVIVFSNEPSNEEGVRLFQQGIKGYLNTFATVERIQQAVNTVQAGNVWLGQSIMQAMIQSIGQSPVENNAWQDELTQREIEVCDLVLNSQSNRDIAQHLAITERTVKAHLHNIFEKFAVKDRLSLALKIKNWQV